MFYIKVICQNHLCSVFKAPVIAQLLLTLSWIERIIVGGRHWWPCSRQSKTNRFSNDKKEIDLSWNYLVLCQYLLIYCLLFVLPAYSYLLAFCKNYMDRASSTESQYCSTPLKYLFASEPIHDVSEFNEYIIYISAIR